MCLRPSCRVISTRAREPARSTTRNLSALAARKIGFHDVPLLCASEISVPGAMPRVVRLLMHIETGKPRSELEHVYLRGAVALRLDIAQ